MVYDFDIMLQRRKEMNSKRRRRKNVDIINDSDEVIAELIHEMKQASDVSDKLLLFLFSCLRICQKISYGQTGIFVFYFYKVNNIVFCISGRL